MHSFWDRYIAPPGDVRLYTTGSHDVTGHNDDGFEGTYSYLYHDMGNAADRVIFETSGPGMVYLIRTGGFYDGELLAYLDGDAQPTHRWNFDDLYGGNTEIAGPERACREKLGHGSAWAFIGLPFSRGCKLVARNVSGEYHFFNIFAARGAGCQAVDPPTQPTAPKGHMRRYVLEGKSRCELLCQCGTGTVTGIYLRIPERADINRALRGLRLRAYWDGEKRAAVDAPIGLLFGVGYTGLDEEYPHYELRGKTGSLFIPTGRCATRTPCFGEISEGFYYFCMPMPFEANARLELINQDGHGITCDVDINVSPDAPPKDFGHFYAVHRSETNLLTGSDYTALSVRGSGYFMGGVYRLSGRCYDAALLKVQRAHLEGDARFYIDDAKGFINAATGTEEYFNWGWYDTNGDRWPGDDRPFSFPTHGYPEHIADVEDHSTMYRLHTLDPVPFHSALTFALEHGPDGREPADYESVAFCYLNPGRGARLVALKVLDETDVARYEAVRVWEGNDQVWIDELRTLGVDWLAVHGELRQVSIVKGETVLNLSVPEGAKRVVVRRQYDGAWGGIKREGEPEGASVLGAQAAEVFLDGASMGIWRLPPRHARDCWMQDDFVIALDGRKRECRLTIRNLEPTCWNACAYWALIG